MRIRSPLWPEGEGRRLVKSSLLLPRSWEEGVFNFRLLLARRGREEVSISFFLSGQKGEEEGSPAFLACRGKGKHLEPKPF